MHDVQKQEKRRDIETQPKEEASHVYPLTETYLKDCKRSNQQRKGGGAKITYINMHGGRSREKWLEVRNLLEKEKSQVYAFTETFLRGLEEPLVMHESR